MSAFYKGPCTAVVVRRHSDGKVLVTSRRYDHAQIGLPGGKVDPEDGPLVGDPWRGMDSFWTHNSQTLLAGARREVLEETGVDLRSYCPILIWSGLCENATAPEGLPRYYPTWAFEVTYYDDVDPVSPPGEPPCRWATWEEICADSQPFKTYNRALYRCLYGKGIDEVA